MGLFYPTHSLGPVMKWFGDDRIDFVVALGSGNHTQPSYRQEDTTTGLLQMKSGKLVKIRIDCVSRRPHAMANYSLQGTKGVYESSRNVGKSVVSFSDGDKNPWWQPLDSEEYAGYMPKRYRLFKEKAAGAGHGGGDYFIVQDFIDAVKGIKPPSIDVYEACEWTAVGLLSALSVSNRGRAMDMPNFRSNNINDHILTL